MKYSGKLNEKTFLNNWFYHIFLNLIHYTDNQVHKFTQRNYVHVMKKQ